MEKFLLGITASAIEIKGGETCEKYQDEVDAVDYEAAEEHFVDKGFDVEFPGISRYFIIPAECESGKQLLKSKEAVL